MSFPISHSSFSSQLYNKDIKIPIKAITQLYSVACLMFLFYKRFLQLQTCKKKNEPKCFLYSTWCSLCFTLPHCLFLWLDTRFEIDLLWLKLRLVFNQSPEHSSPFSSQCIRTQPAEYQPNPSTVLLVIFSFFFLFLHTDDFHSPLQTLFMHAHTQTRDILQYRHVLWQYFQEIVPFLSL